MTAGLAFIFSTLALAVGEGMYFNRDLLNASGRRAMWSLLAAGGGGLGVLTVIVVAHGGVLTAP